MPDKPEMADEGVAESSVIPVSLVDDTPAPGDTITLRVVSVDESTGNITVTKAESEAEPEEAMAGSESMAAEFEPTPTT